MSIGSDEYKIELCGLTDNECVGHDCRTCEVAAEHKKTFRKDELHDELDEYTKFEYDQNIRGIPVNSNVSNYIAKADMAALKALQEMEIVPKQAVEYDPVNFPWYAMDLQKLRQYNNLPTPDEIWAPVRPDWQNHDTKPMVAAFRWGDVVYLIAPRIEGV